MINMNAYAESIFLPNVPALNPICPDCNTSPGGYRGSECCIGCYRDRYAETPDEQRGEDE